jgi:hypothetical protein
MSYAVEVVSNVVIYVPSFMKIGEGDENLLRGILYIHVQQRDTIRLFLFFQNKENELKHKFQASFKIIQYIVYLTARKAFRSFDLR